MQTLRSSNELIGDPRGLQRRLEDDGYLVLRDVIDTGIVAQAKARVMAWFESQGYIDPVDGEPRWTGADLSGLGGIPPALFETRTWEWLAAQPTMQRLYETVFGERGAVLPIGQYQFVWPNKPDTWGHIHQDGPYSAGIDFKTFWIPLMDVDESLGGLAMAPGLHHEGSKLEGLAMSDVESRFIPKESIPDDRWARTDTHPGDVIVFHTFMPHCGLPNTSDRLRLSIDFRVRPSSSPAPVIGVVTDATDDGLTISSEAGELVALRVDGSTLMRGPAYSFQQPTPREFLGRRVLATSSGGTARMIRIPIGHVTAPQ
jgi:ectoine hydroxylase-related dioxygenase (phytanoyl-CoA dioxygenase family)